MASPHQPSTTKINTRHHKIPFLCFMFSQIQSIGKNNEWDKITLNLASIQAS